MKSSANSSTLPKELQQVDARGQPTLKPRVSRFAMENQTTSVVTPPSGGVQGALTKARKISLEAVRALHQLTQLKHSSLIRVASRSPKQSTSLKKSKKEWKEFRKLEQTPSILHSRQEPNRSYRISRRQSTRSDTSRMSTTITRCTRKSSMKSVKREKKPLFPWEKKTSYSLNKA